jgi:hypothetical protein
MRITIDVDGREITVHQVGVVRLGQVLELVEDALRGAGFHFHPGTLRVDVSAPDEPSGMKVVEAEVM